MTRGERPLLFRKGLPNFTYGRYGGRPVWMRAADIMAEPGAPEWWTRPVMRRRLPDVPYDTLKMIWTRMADERLIERAEIGDRIAEGGARWSATPFYAYRLTEKGRARLEQWRAVYELVG